MHVSAKTTRVSESEVALAAGVLARAFHKDPPFVYFVPDAAERARILPAFFTRFVRYGSLCGEVHGLPGGQGVAIWLSEQEMSPAGMKAAGLDQLPEVFGEIQFERLSKFLDFMGQSHHKLMPARHWYLAFVGIDPAHQGNGFGTALLEPMLARAQAEGLPCYLETFLDRNVAFYRKNGFELVSEGTEPASQCRYWTFRR